MARHGSQAEPRDPGAEAPGVLGGLSSTRPARLGGQRTPPTAKAPDGAARLRGAPEDQAVPLPPRPPSRRTFPPGPLELLAAAIRTSGQLAHVGVNAWERAAKIWLDRLPRF